MMATLSRTPLFAKPHTDSVDGDRSSEREREKEREIERGEERERERERERGGASGSFPQKTVSKSDNQKGKWS